MQWDHQSWVNYCGSWALNVGWGLIVHYFATLWANASGYSRWIKIGASNEQMVELRKVREVMDNLF